MESHKISPIIETKCSLGLLNTTKTVGCGHIGGLVKNGFRKTVNLAAIAKLQAGVICPSLGMAPLRLLKPI